MTGENIIDVDCCQQAKHGQFVAGDVFASKRIAGEGRVIAVLSDGLGSGVKASVLANLTATMALKFTGSVMDVRQSARTIMDTLPVCETRKISYSTFTIVDLGVDGEARVIEHGNPEFILLRGAAEVPVEKTTFTLENWRERVISYSEFRIERDDRIVCCSDGISQSGLGRPGFPLGWGRGPVVGHAHRLLLGDPGLSARGLAGGLAREALANDGGQARDDITCGVIHLRQPRRLLLVTGPPYNRERDAELAERVRGHTGRTAICGGTTAGIIGRRLGRDIAMNMASLDPEVPPSSMMEGVDIVTEGTVTLARVAQRLERPTLPVSDPVRATGTAADQLLALLLDSDVIEFIVGTRINDAHQDPSVPVELDLRRNIVRRIAAALESRHLKTVSTRYL